MSQRKGATTAGHAETEVKPQGQAQNKQAILLAQDAGHFSLIKAMHLADVITEMNGFCGCMCLVFYKRGQQANTVQSCLSYPLCGTAWATEPTPEIYGLRSSSCHSACSSICLTARLQDGGRRVP